MKIAFVSNGSPNESSGAGQSTRLIIEELENHGIEVDTFSITGEKSRREHKQKNIYTIPSGDNYPIHKRIGNILSPLQHLPSLDEYDVIHSYGTSQLPGIILRARLSKTSTPILATVNTLSWVRTNWTRYLKQGCPEYSIRKLFEYITSKNYPFYLVPPKIMMEVTGKALSKRADYFTVQTAGMAKLLSESGYNRKRIKVIPNVLDKRFYAQSPSLDKKVIYVGRLVEKKGIMSIVDAFVSINGEYPDWKFKILGSGPLKRDITQKIKEYKDISVDYCPYEELPNQYRSASVLVHGSRYPEPFSRTWLEAMASETAIVASRNPSSEEVLEDVAELYDPFSQRDLRLALESVIKNNSKRRQMRMRGKEHIEKYRPQKIVPQFINIYGDLANRTA